MASPCVLLRPAASGDEDTLSGHRILWFVLRVVRCSHSNSILVTK